MRLTHMAANGKLAHERKYVDVMKAKHPTATVVLVKLDASILFSRESTRVSIRNSSRLGV